MSDHAFVQDCKVLNLLEEGDGVMADRGFTISDLLPFTKSLFCPAFLEGRAQLPTEESVSRGIGSLHVLVERVIRRVNTFHILSQVFL